MSHQIITDVLRLIQIIIIYFIKGKVYYFISFIHYINQSINIQYIQIDIGWLTGR